MMKNLLLAIVALVLVISPLSAITFTDVPANHWANKAVYGIVKYGVTQGYPDGTFRGTRTINRYELSVFLWNLVQAMEARIEEAKTTAKGAASSKAINELKAELDNLRAELAAVKAQKVTKKEDDSLKTEFVIGARARLKEILNDDTNSQLYENRLIAKVSKQIADNTKALVKYDTQWINFATQDLFGADQQKKLDISLSTAIDIGMEDLIYVEVTSGPGSNTNYYKRLDDALLISTSIAGFDILWDHELGFNSLSLGYSLPDFGMGVIDLSATGEAYNDAINPFSETDSRIYKMIVEGATDLDNVAKGLKFSGLAGFNLKGDDDFKGKKSAIQFQVELGDVFDIDQTYLFKLSKTGSEYYEAFANNTSAETTLRKWFLYTNIDNGKTIWEFNLKQGIYGFNTSWYFNIIANDGWTDDADNEYCLTISKAIDCTNINDLKVSKPVTWFANIYKKIYNDETEDDYIRSGLIFKF